MQHREGVRHFFAREESESRLWLAVATSVVGQLLAVALHCGRSCGVGRGLKTGPSQRMQKYDGHPHREMSITFCTKGARSGYVTAWAGAGQLQAVVLHCGPVCNVGHGLENGLSRAGAKT